MIVSELKRYLDKHHSASAGELARKFALSEDGVDAMLNILIRKGLISKMLDTDREANVKRVRYIANQPRGLSLTVTL